MGDSGCIREKFDNNKAGFVVTVVAVVALLVTMVVVANRLETP